VMCDVTHHTARTAGNGGWVRRMKDGFLLATQCDIDQRCTDADNGFVIHIEGVLKDRI
jgi:hypothetical protein